jgi:multidrug resistance efflux pump
MIANFRETDLKNVRPGVAARITVMTNHVNRSRAWSIRSAPAFCLKAERD